MLKELCRRKSVQHIVRETQAGAPNDRGASLKRALRVHDLVAFGIAAIIGSGISTTIGQAAFDGGPAVSALFILIAGACGFTAFCYAEFASMIPISGSAYTYGYAVLGEGIAWLIGWDLLLEYALIVAAVASGWSGYVLNLLDAFGIHVPDALRGAPDSGNGHVFNLIGAVVALGYLCGYQRVFKIARRHACSGNDGASPR